MAGNYIHLQQARVGGWLLEIGNILLCHLGVHSSLWACTDGKCKFIVTLITATPVALFSVFLWVRSLLFHCPQYVWFGQI